MLFCFQWFLPSRNKQYPSLYADNLRGVSPSSHFQNFLFCCETKGLFFFIIQVELPVAKEFSLFLLGYDVAVSDTIDLVMGLARTLKVFRDGVKNILLPNLT